MKSCVQRWTWWRFAQQVERGGRLRIGADHALRIGRAGFGGEGDVVDVVAAVRGQLDAADRLGIGRPRLGELTRHAAELHDRELRCEGQDDRHLEDDAEGVADVVRAMLGEGLGAVATLKQECLAGCDLGERRGQVARFAGEDQWREGRELIGRGGQRCGVGIGGELPCFVTSPAVGGPVRGHIMSSDW
jgi:hypothetical protein